MPRAALVVVWLMAASLTGGLAVLAYELSRPPVIAPQKPLDELPKARHEANPWAQWSVTEQLSAHHVLIVQVETRHLAVDPHQSVVHPANPSLVAARLVPAERWSTPGGRARRR